MSDVKKLISQADTIADTKLPDDVSVDLQSFVATYKAKREAKDSRGQAAWARAVVNRARRDGVEVQSSGGSGKGPTKKDLEAEIARRNEGREEDDLIVPEGTNKADLEKALADDDARG